jgi:hypothetical protein
MEVEEVKRVQRSRVKGWKMPENTVYVGRPTKFGNPYSISYVLQTREAVLKAYEEWLKSKIDFDPHFLDELKGKNLACWCTLNQKCHADILLRFVEALK